jgi:hypothetical protein
MDVFLTLNCVLRTDSSYAQHLVPRCEALRRYTYWLALESLPLEVRRICLLVVCLFSRAVYGWTKSLPHAVHLSANVTTMC